MSLPRPFPEGSRVLHVGPPKTGSTALQDALHQAREALVRQGVSYASRVRHEVVPARFVTGQLPDTPKWAWAAQRWEELVDAMRADGPARTVYSSEYLADATEEQIVRVVDAIGPEDVQVVITLRPLVDIVPSQYQQYLQGGLTTDYETWLRETFEGSEASLGFWLRHRHDALVERWARLAGRDRVVVVASDGRDFDAVPAAFERLLGLAGGTLLGLAVRPNRSMTWPEAEVMRRFNVEAQRSGLVDAKYETLTKYAADGVKERIPRPDEPRIVTPAWATARADALGAEFASAIAEAGVRVIGDLSALCVAHDGDGTFAGTRIRGPRHRGPLRSQVRPGRASGARGGRGAPCPARLGRAAGQGRRAPGTRAGRPVAPYGVAPARQRLDRGTTRCPRRPA